MKNVLIKIGTLCFPTLNDIREVLMTMLLNHSPKIYIPLIPKKKNYAINETNEVNELARNYCIDSPTIFGASLENINRNMICDVEQIGYFYFNEQLFVAFIIKDLNQRHLYHSPYDIAVFAVLDDHIKSWSHRVISEIQLRKKSPILKNKLITLNRVRLDSVPPKPKRLKTENDLYKEYINKIMVINGRLNEIRESYRLVQQEKKELQTQLLIKKKKLVILNKNLAKEYTLINALKKKYDEDKSDEEKIVLLMEFANDCGIGVLVLLGNLLDCRVDTTDHLDILTDSLIRVHWRLKDELLCFISHLPFLHKLNVKRAIQFWTFVYPVYRELALYQLSASTSRDKIEKKRKRGQQQQASSLYKFGSLIFQIPDELQGQSEEIIRNSTEFKAFVLFAQICSYAHRPLALQSNPLMQLIVSYLGTYGHSTEIDSNNNNNI
jgi:hypothetical protein